MGANRISDKQRVLAELASTVGVSAQELGKQLAPLRGDPANLSIAEVEEARAFVRRYAAHAKTEGRVLSPAELKRELRDKLAEYTATSRRAQAELGQVLEARLGEVAGKKLYADVVTLVRDQADLPLSEVALVLPRLLDAAGNDPDRALQGLEQVARLNRAHSGRSITDLAAEVQPSLATPLLQVALEAGELQARLRIGSADRLVGELQKDLHLLGFDDELKWKGKPSGKFDEATAAALRAYAKSRRVEGAESYDGKSVSVEIANLMLREVAVVRDRDGLDNSLGVLISELRAKQPAILQHMTTAAIEVMGITDRAQKTAAIHATFAALQQDMQSAARQLSAPAREAWRALLRQFDAASQSGDELRFSRVMLDTFLVALAAALREQDQAAAPAEAQSAQAAQLAEAFGRASELFEAIVLSDRTRFQETIRTLTQAIAAQDRLALPNILSNAINLGELEGLGDKSTAIDSTLKRLRNYLGELHLSGPGEDAFKVFAAQIDEAEKSGTLIPLARLAFPIFIDEVKKVTGARPTGEQGGKRPAPAAALREAQALEDALGRLGGFGVTAGLLRQIAPSLSRRRSTDFARPMSEAMAWGKIDTVRQRAAFIAQLAHESGGFRYMVELGPPEYFTHYEEGKLGKMLGNTEPGDGYRFRGRGLIQLTGRVNYKEASRVIFHDDRLLRDPDLAASPEVAFKIAAWYWQSRGINGPAERGDFREVTRRINGGYNGLEDRMRYYNRATNVLPPPAAT